VVVKEKVEAAIKMLEGEGHSVVTQVRLNKKSDRADAWFSVDSRLLLSWGEMVDLADGVYSLAQLEEAFKRRQLADKPKD
jgi:hypothetical protein